LLDDWEAGFHPPFDGIRLVGHRWSAESHRLREFLARNLVPFRWLDVERDAVEAQRCATPWATVVCRSSSSPTGRPTSSRRSVISLSPSACGRPPRRGRSICWSWARDRRDSRLRCTGRPRGCAPRSSRALHPAARRGRAHGSRTTRGTLRSPAACGRVTPGRRDRAAGP
jgi:hypothetical protein